MCGDWNLVINRDLDTNNYLHINNPRARNEILENIMEEDDFLYIYRIYHEDKKEYTWESKESGQKQARLYFFLISSDCFLYADATNIIPGYRTDHSDITMDLVLNYNNERGRGYWKFSIHTLPYPSLPNLSLYCTISLPINPLLNSPCLVCGDQVM